MTWLSTRAHLVAHRYELAVRAADHYPDAPRVAGTPLLTRPTWLPARPLPLDAVDLQFEPVGFSPRPDGSYAETMARLAPPAVFEDRPTYRLLEADLTGPRGRLRFGRGSYFDSVNTGEAYAHEYAAGGGTPLRDAIGDPCDPARRPVNMAISTLTVRRDTAGSTFFAHWRDPAKVGHAGGLHQVVPVGVFQPATDERADFSLWRCMLREFAEELLGAAEDYPTPTDYDTWPFAARMTGGLRDGRIRAYCLGLGVDPLTFATDLLTAVVIDAPLFDDLFPDVVRHNSEGVVSGRDFTSGEIQRLLAAERFQAAGAALLTLAAQHLA